MFPHVSFIVEPALLALFKRVLHKLSKTSGNAHNSSLIPCMHGTVWSLFIGSYLVKGAHQACFEKFLQIWIPPLPMSSEGVFVYKTPVTVERHFNGHSRYAKSRRETHPGEERREVQTSKTVWMLRMQKSSRDSSAKALRK